MSIPQVYLAIAERIRAKMGDQTGEDADEMLQRAGEPYDYVLYFLWACYHAEDKIYAPNLSILDAPETQNWEKSTRDEIFPKKSTPQVVDLSTSSIHQGLPSGTITAITKLSDTMIAHQEAALKNQEEKADSRLKAWRKVPKLQQNVILLGGVEENGVIPSTPTEEFYAIIGCQNGVQVDQFLHQAMPGFNVNFEPGFCTALHRGMLVSPNDTGTPRNMTAFSEPPQSDTVVSLV